eukprot:bmy_17174T0
MTLYQPLLLKEVEMKQVSPAHPIQASFIPFVTPSTSHDNLLSASPPHPRRIRPHSGILPSWRDSLSTHAGQKNIMTK